MNLKELVEALEERPFMPMRLHMSNGRTHGVRYREMAIVGEGAVVLGVEKPGSTYPRIRMISLPHLNEVETIPHEPPAKSEEANHGETSS